MFIGSKVNHHKKYGEGVVEDLVIKSENELNSLITVRFNSGEVKKFPISIFITNEFMSIEDKDAIEYVLSLKAEKDLKDKEKAALREKAYKEKVYIPSYNLDEVEKEVKKEDWEKALKVADTYRFANESRAVVMDSDLVFINASAAMRYINARVKDCDKIYKSCELRNKRFMNHHWSYATKANIIAIINSIEENNEK